MTAQPTAIHRKDYRAPDFRIETVELEFDLQPEATRVKSRLAIAPQSAGAPLKLDGEDLELLSVVLNGRKLATGDYTADEHGLTIASVPSAPFTLEIETKVNPKGNTHLSGLYQSSGVYCTQCEAQGFRRITYFLDRPDVMSTYRVTIRADKTANPVLLSNGNLVEEGSLSDGRHFAVWHDPFPKPCYLFALVAGDLAVNEDEFVTRSGRKVALRIFVEHGKVPRTAYAMDALKRSMRWDETRFDLEYDLDLFNIVAVSDFNMGAMENKSLNVFNDKYILADPETATDTDYAGIEAVVAHEYFHNWTGNRITCRDWFQLSLKEGLTVFRDQEFTSDMRSRPVKRIQDVRLLRGRQFPEDAGPLAHPIRPDSYIAIDNFYTATVYEKGSEVIRMIHTMLGEDGFQKGMKLYVERHDGEAATCDQFVAAMADANMVDLRQFQLWYSQAGTPEVAVEGRYDDKSGDYELTVTQTVPPTPGQPDKQPMQMPLGIGLLDAQGRDIALKADAAAMPRPGLLNVTASKQTFKFESVPEPKAISLNRGFSAPVIVKAKQPGEAQAFLMAHDSDAFARWEAGQQYATELLLTRVADPSKPFDPAFIEAIGQTLRDNKLEPAFIAEAITLPSEDYIADRMAVVDVEGIHAARRALRLEIVRTYRKQFENIYASNTTPGAYSPDATSAGRRALKNAALSYLSELADEDAGLRKLIHEQYAKADNMTDRAAALRLLVDIAGPEREAALADFYRRFADDALVLDKWLMLQAISALPETLENVRSLLTHPAFSMQKPNKVRSLIGAFTANALRYHAADGSGYAFHADRMLELEPINPQVAARLLAPLGRWRRFDPGRQEKMKAELRRVLAKPNLSRDVYEIASKSLEN
ncbi:aminopeptidase N [Ferrovibrio sp.]|uniref:aminopeptidase N n=1 Tax=Ferrovibrio sp. TaxID=1917215 RepID=UPI000CA655CC|nr:aminopeptidase N [Ferrovibrio sp.]PJI38051.1 MAG: aminopeptidase N [Ferrovibrio sp.]